MDKFELCICEGVEGKSIILNDFRIAGSKPWGGGSIINKWTITTDDIERALDMKLVKENP